MKELKTGDKLRRKDFGNGTKIVTFVGKCTCSPNCNFLRAKDAFGSITTYPESYFELVEERQLVFDWYKDEV